MAYGSRNELITIFLEYNSKLNLSALRTAEDVYVKHILDSLEIVKVLTFFPWATIADVWTGGWFPLLALATHYPHCQFVWIDARRKKTEAVQAIANRLWLTNVSVRRWRIEEQNDNYDYITARAVAYGDKLVRWCTPLLAHDGKLILYKQYDEEEKKILIKESHKVVLHLERDHRYRLFDGDIERAIYVFNKLI